jgi:8-amino-7-oxononanoate synthase
VADSYQRRKDLFSIITHFHDLLDPVLKRTPADVLRYPTDHSAEPFPRGLSIETKPPAPIVGLLTSTPHALSTFLLEKGFIVRPVVPPTVPPGEERVRVCLRAGIDRDVVKSLVGAIEEWTRLLVQNTQTRDGLRAKL